MIGMARPALATFLLATTLAVAPAALAQETERKLYRWTDSTGKFHYTDSLPPDIVNQARAELSARTGLVRREIGRALTEAERRELEAELASETERVTRRENIRRAEEAKVSSFRTEAALRAAYIERQAVIDETIESLEAALDAQRSSLHQQLGLAGDAELAGRPVAERTRSIIADLRNELSRQEQARIERAAERQVLQEEMERLVVLFRERQQAADREAAEALNGRSIPST